MFRRDQAIGTVQGLQIDSAKTYESLFVHSREFFDTTLIPYHQEFRWPAGRLYNGKFNSVEAEFLYSMIRRFKPKQFVEIGSGHSTDFASDAIRANGPSAKTQITCVDPSPRRILPTGVRHFAQRVEEVPLSIFSQLEAGDILSIDSSHFADEARYHLEKIYPVLKAGVYIHTHDIFYPYKPVNPEEAMVLDYYVQHPREYEVLCGILYLRYYEPQHLLKLIPSFRWSAHIPAAVPPSLWAIKRA